jgi:hypothetical protein
MNRNSIRASLLLAGLAAATGLARAENYGRLTTSNEVVTTSIFPEGDADDITFDAAKGWKVQATMKVKGQVDITQATGDPPLTLKPLLPVLELLSPDGTVAVTGKSSKKAATLKATLATGGRFAFRLRGTSGTGVAELKWKLLAAKVPTVKKLPLDPDTTTFYEFPARGGCLLSWTLSFKGDGAAQVTKVLDPDGNEIPFDPSDPFYVTRKPTSEKVKSLPIPAGLPGGQYRLQVENRIFSSTMTLAIQVVLPKLPVSKATLTRLEPVLTSIGRSESGCGVTIPLTGLNLDPAPKGVYFGRNLALGAEVSKGGSETSPDTCSAVVPSGTGTVDVVFVASDGQEGVLHDAFTFSPLPTITSFDPTVGPGVGNIVMTVTGTGFEPGSQDLYKVLVGGVQSSEVAVVDDHTITCRIPAHVAGPKQVVLRNKCGEDVIAPGVFTYATGLFISTIVPPAVPSFGHVPVTVYGTGFALTNQVSVDGVPLPSTPVVYMGTVIGHRVSAADLPAHAPGKVEMKVAEAANSAVKPNGLAYYGFTDITATAIPAATDIDDWGGVSTASADTNGDGTIDYVFITHTQALSTYRPGTRVLKNNGAGVFTDVTEALMPAASITEGLGGNKVLVNNFNTVDGAPDIYLSRPGTGTEARKTSDGRYIDAFGLMLFGYTGGGFDIQPHSGSGTKLAINGTLTRQACYVYDFDYRSVNAALGDLDGSLNNDIVLVNDRSIATFVGTNCATKWQTCVGGYYSACYSYSKYPIGNAMRLCTVSSSGSVFDRTIDLLKAAFSSADDFRAVAVAVGDMDADYLNDIVITHNDWPGGSLASCTRAFKQKQTGLVVSYNKFNPSFIPVPSSGADDDWRGDAVAIPDLNADLYRDLVVSYDGDLPNGRAYSTRILMQDSFAGKLVDKTDTLMPGLLPAGDNGRAKFIYSQDLDRDGDADLILVTPNSTGAGNPQTRYLLNTGKDDLTGLPVFVNATSLLPITGTETGNGVCLLAVDIDGDGDLDIIITDTHQTSGTPVKRTRVWRQDR